MRESDQIDRQRFNGKLQPRRVPFGSFFFFVPRELTSRFQSTVIELIKLLLERLTRDRCQVDQRARHRQLARCAEAKEEYGTITRPSAQWFRVELAHERSFHHVFGRAARFPLALIIVS